MVAPSDERAWLAEVARRPWLARQFAYLRRGGPGYLQSALTLGGGTASACLLAGGAFRFELLWVAPLGMLLGGIVFAAIAHQTLSSGMRPFEAMRVHAGPVFAWGWAIGTVLASIVWHFAQYSLASAVLADLFDLAGLTVPRWSMGALVLAWSVATALSFERVSSLRRGVERLMRWMVWTIVLLFGLVALRIGMSDPLAIARGFVPTIPQASHGVEAVPVILSGLATAVGVNMTFLYPYSLRDRGWAREHREYAIADIAFGMVLPFVAVTSLIVIVAGATLSAEFSGATISPIESARTLGGLLGPVWGRVAFDLGLMGMLLTTVTLHMVCSGLACSEMFGLERGSRGHRIATLLPTPGVLGSVFWSSLSVWLVVPTSLIAGALLPLAYLGFVKLQLSDAYLGADRPRGLRGALWTGGMVLAALVVLAFVSLYAVDRIPDFLRQLGLLSGTP
jgi:manganese transport protein